VKTTKANLHEKLKSYGRPTWGNRTEMLDRLCQFSNDRDEWLRCVTGMCLESVLISPACQSLFKPKLKWKWGEHNSCQSLSKKRIDEVFGIEEQTITYKSKKSANCTQWALQDDDRAANSAWVSRSDTMSHKAHILLKRHMQCYQRLVCLTIWVYHLW
jgi:hypothetical protein